MPSKKTDLETVLESRSGFLHFLYNTRGNVMPMAAIGMIAMAGMVGGGVDISRAYMVQNRLQNACDSGVLAGRRAVAENGYTTAAQTQAENYFYTNFDQNIEGAESTTFVTTATENDNRIDGLATTKLDTAVMSLFGFDEVDISVDCTASMSVGNSDVMMVLDTTGSMGSNLGGQTRLRALQDAMKGFYDTVQTASAGSNARIRYGFVPYSSSINVGQVLNDLNPAYLADVTRIQSKEAVYEEVEVQVADGWEDPDYYQETSTGDITGSDWVEFSGPHRNRRTCRRDEQPNNTGWINSGSTTTTTETTINGSGQQVVTTTTTQNQTRSSYQCARGSDRRWYVEVRTETRPSFVSDIAISDPKYITTTTTEFDRYVYKPVDMDTSGYKTFSNTTTVTGNNGSNETSVWEGCIEERATVSNSTFSWNSLTGLSPSGALDLDIDMAPTSDPDTQWKPMWPEMVYYRTSDSSGRYYTSNNESNWGFQANSYCPRAARTLSEMTEGEFDAYADSLNAEGNTYHDIGMIWGARLASPTGIFRDNVIEDPANGGSVARHIIFMTDGAMVPNYGIQSAYGLEYHDRRVTDNGYSNHSSRHSERFLAVCAQAKAKGLRVWVIAFASSLTSNLVECASDDSSFLAANASQLNAAFQEIAKDVGELRVTQ